MTELQATKPRPASRAKAASGRLFVIEINAGCIHAMNPDGSDKKTIVTNCRMPDGIVVDTEARHIYWTNMGVPNLDDGSMACRPRARPPSTTLQRTLSSLLEAIP